MTDILGERQVDKATSGADDDLSEEDCIDESRRSAGDNEFTRIRDRTGGNKVESIQGEMPHFDMCIAEKNS